MALVIGDYRMTIKLSAKGGGTLKFAPDLTYVSNLSNSAEFLSSYLQTGDINGSAGLVTAISLLGKFSFSALQIINNAVESYTLKLTVDGVVIWNSSKTLGLRQNLIGAIAGAANSNAIAYTETYICETSLLLEVQSTTDTAVKFNYIARPIL